MANERYPCYVKIRQVEHTGLVELPTEKDGTMLLTTVTSQFPGALGLRFKSETGTWRAVNLNGNILDIPLNGWGDSTSYYVVSPNNTVVSPNNTVKRKATNDNEESPLEKISRMTEKEILSDMVVLSLPFTATEHDLRKHFQRYGALDMCEIKTETRDGQIKSRGFGFIRFKTVEAVKACLQEDHSFEGRDVQVTYPKDKAISTKLFIGQLPEGIKCGEMRAYFEQFGEIKDAHIPTPFKGYGFVTYRMQSAARAVLAPGQTHTLGGQELNVKPPTPQQRNNRQNRQPSNDKGYVWNPPGSGNQGYGAMQAMQGMRRFVKGGVLPGDTEGPQSGARNYGYGNSNFY